MRHRLPVVLALTACAVLAGATSLLAVGEWIADAPAHVPRQVGARRNPLLPWRVLPSETTVRRPLARIDGDAPDRTIGRLARGPPTERDRDRTAPRTGRGRQESAGAARAKGRAGKSLCSPRRSTPPD
ncbi:transposase family protein [Streptomyces sp. NBC_00358]|uniref:transposase family protein n=1 Tax=Streptomyces sp. NBC_00358 TaxID=2975725 RepID=UPI002E273CB0